MGLVYSLEGWGRGRAPREGGEEKGRERGGRKDDEGGEIDRAKEREEGERQILKVLKSKEDASGVKGRGPSQF